MKRYTDAASRRRNARPAATPVRDAQQKWLARAGVPLAGIAIALVLAASLRATTSPGTSTPSTIPLATAGPGSGSPVPYQVVPPVSVLSAGIMPHTCLVLPPLRGKTQHIVFIDPGHGGLDPGTSGTTTSGKTIYEKDLTLAVGLDVTTTLRNEGYTVVLARNTDTLITRIQSGDVNGKLLTAAGEHRDIVARVACANAANAEALVSIHFNAYADPSVNGAETLYDNARPFSAANKRLALLAQAAVLARLRALGWAVPDRGTMNDIAAGTPALTTEGTAYGHLLELGPAASGWLKFPSTMPGILIEPLFLTHPAEADVASSVEGQRAIATGLAQAIDAFFAANARGAA
jgi:N-acetylmuramoyl-L-alanine amidase